MAITAKILLFTSLLFVWVNCQDGDYTKYEWLYEAEATNEKYYCKLKTGGGCSGAMIGQNLFATNSRCYWDGVDGADIECESGKTRRSHSVVKFPTENVFFDFSVWYLQPINEELTEDEILPLIDSSLPVGKEVTLVGRGIYTTVDELFSTLDGGKLRFFNADLLIRNEDTCGGRWDTDQSWSDLTVCAQVANPPGGDLDCPNHAGDPIISVQNGKPFLVGIDIGGCYNSDNNPAAYADVTYSPIRNWLNDQIYKSNTITGTPPPPPHNNLKCSIRVYAAKNIPLESVKNENPLPDVFAIIQANGITKKTPTVMNDQNPRWGRKVHPEFILPCNELEKIRVTLRDSNKYTKNSVIGTAVFTKIQPEILKSHVRRNGVVVKDAQGTRSQVNMIIRELDVSTNFAESSDTLSEEDTTGAETDDDSNNNDGLSGGAIAGIVIGSICGVILIIVIAIMIASKKSRSTERI